MLIMKVVGFIDGIAFKQHAYEVPNGQHCRYLHVVDHCLWTSSVPGCSKLTTSLVNVSLKCFVKH